MIYIYARLVKQGARTIESVPETYRDKVIELLEKEQTKQN
jgi:hypothetical protein